MPKKADYQNHELRYDMNWIRCTEKIYDKFLHDPRFDQDKKRFESLPNINTSTSLPPHLRVDVNGDEESPDSYACVNSPKENPAGGQQQEHEHEPEQEKKSNGKLPGENAVGILKKIKIDDSCRSPTFEIL